MIDVFKNIKFEKVSVGFEGQEILQACDFDFPMNKNCRFVFTSDREKYFFFHAASQVEGFTSGTYSINDENVLDMSFEDFMRFRINMGFGFSTRGLLQNRTLRQNLSLPLEFHNLFVGPEREEWLNNCLEYFDIRTDLDKRPSDVSPSSQKATLILRAFIHKPELVFLDTPEALLSKRHQANLLQMIDDHRKHYNLRHLFFATADEDLSDCLADEYIILRKKRLKLVTTQKKNRGVA